uniref:P-type domain-containing protein n=1 Tax=Chelydra serpentina TaxID=8475 RepID=A0A8C3TIP6_CHESE
MHLMKWVLAHKSATRTPPQPFHSSTCPTTISEDRRQDCHPEPGATETACISRGCRWCETSALNVPFCFYDSVEDPTCLNNVPVQKRIDCHPQLGASKEACEAKGCIWCSTKVSNAPWCSFPEDEMILPITNMNCVCVHTHTI